ncbi:MAG: ADP-ribosylglycohydrolase family protein [Nitrososphaeraceae archaeon]
MTNIKYDKLKGCFVGLAIGDALGTPLEFSARDEYSLVEDMIGGGPFNLNPGEWTDDTSMALCAAHSLISNKSFNPENILDNFVNWWQTGFMSHNNKCFDIGMVTQQSLILYQLNNIHPLEIGSKDDHHSGNGSIMRLAPFVVFNHNNIDECITMCQDQSKLTHGSRKCLYACEVMGKLIYNLCNGGKWNDFIDYNTFSNLTREQIKSSGYVIDTLKAAIWAVTTTRSFEEALILAVNLADDSDTVGAVTGQLAGARYGYSSIPSRWLDKLVWKDKIEEMFEQLMCANNN